MQTAPSRSRPTSPDRTRSDGAPVGDAERPGSGQTGSGQTGSGHTASGQPGSEPSGSGPPGREPPDSREPGSRQPRSRRLGSGPLGSVPPGNLQSASRRFSRLVRAIRRSMAVLLLTVVAVPVQAVLILLPGRAKVAFARLYWNILCRAVGVRVRVIGTPATALPGGRPVVFASNHSSWLDIRVLGGAPRGLLRRQGGGGGWPVMSTIARLGRTVFVQPRRASTGRERDDMRARLAAGDNLVLFPEGTSSDGSRVMPFRSAFFSVAEGPVTPDGLPPLVQPVSVVYDRLGGLPAGRASRAVFAWYGDMDLAPHYLAAGQCGGLRATVLLHPPLDPATSRPARRWRRPPGASSPKAPPPCGRTARPRPLAAARAGMTGRASSRRIRVRAPGDSAVGRSSP